MSERKRHTTNLEDKMKAILDKLGLAYVEQYPIRGSFILDFALPQERVILECDGKKWHDNRRGYDRWRDKKMSERGWSTIRFSEGDITIENVKNRLSEVRQNG